MHALRHYVYVLFGLCYLTLFAGCGSHPYAIKTTMVPGPAAPVGGVMTFETTSRFVTDPFQIEAPAEMYLQLSSGLSLADPGWTATPLDRGYVRYSQPLTVTTTQPYTFKVNVNINKEGLQRVDVDLFVQMKNGGKEIGSATKLLNVTATGTTITDLPAAWPTDPADVCTRLPPGVGGPAVNSCGQSKH